MTAEQEAAYRVDHAMSPDDSTRVHLIRTVREELDGIGHLSGWWGEVKVT
jgi:hypothetical protein